MKAIRRSALTLLAVTVLLAPSGCATYYGEYAVLSTRTVDLSSFDELEARKSSRRVEGSAEREIYVLLPDRDTFPTLGEAIEAALEEGQGDLILDARVFRWHWYVPMAYGTSGWKVVGNVVDTRSLTAKTPPAPPTPGGGLRIGG